MKKLFITMAICASGALAFGQSQMYIDFGPKILVGPNVLLNESAPFAGGTGANGIGTYAHDFTSIGWSAGFKFAFDFNTSVAIATEALYNQFNQKYVMEEIDTAGTGTNWDKSITYNSIDFPFMLRYNGESMKYVEGGVQYSMILGVNETVGGPYADYDQFKNVNTSDHYAGSKLAAVFGFGGYAWGQENLGVNVGLRFMYTFDDLLVYNGNDRFKVGSPIQTNPNAATTPGFNSPVYALDNRLTGKSQPLSVMLTVELNYDMQFLMAKHSCSGRRKVIIGNK